MSLLRLHCEGRGSGFGPARGAVESALRLLYRGDWPARMWGLVPGRTDVEVTKLRLPVLAGGAAPMRVGFVSDIHVGPTTPRALVDAAFDALAQAQLDMLLLGGDYVFLDATEERMAVLTAAIARVPARRKIGVLGNHDLWADNSVIEAALKRVGVELLLNQQTREGGLTVVGLDDPWTGRPDAHWAFRGVSTDDAIFLLCHSPDGLPMTIAALRALGDRASATYVCGHTHGGHVATPWGPIVVPGPEGRKYPRGLHQVGPVQLYVSRGVGGIEIPVRTYARPEVVVMEMVAKEE